MNGRAFLTTAANDGVARISAKHTVISEST